MSTVHQFSMENTFIDFEVKNITLFVDFFVIFHPVLAQTLAKNLKHFYNIVFFPKYGNIKYVGEEENMTQKIELAQLEG